MKNGIQRFYKYLKTLDSGFRRKDEKEAFSTFYEIIKIKEFQQLIRILLVDDEKKFLGILSESLQTFVPEFKDWPP